MCPFDAARAGGLLQLWQAAPHVLVYFCTELYKSVMAQMNISIPEKLKGWAESRVAEGRYSSTSDYVRDLVRRDQEHEEKRRQLQAAIDEGRKSGISERSISDIIEDGRKRRRDA